MRLGWRVGDRNDDTVRVVRVQRCDIIGRMTTSEIRVTRALVRLKRQG
jgi:hypothetical protein